MPTTPSMDQFDSLVGQVGTLTNLVFALQNQQANPRSNLPKVAPASINASISQVSQVQILGQTSGPTGTQVTVGFQTPGGINSLQVDHFNIWIQLGKNTPAVIATVQHSPCTFTLSSQFNNVTGIIGVQTVMKDGTSLPFTQCPTATLNISISSANVFTQTLTSFSVTGGTPVNIGSSYTIPSTGTYFVELVFQIGSTSSGTGTIALLQNGVQFGGTFLVPINTLAQGPVGLGIFLVPCVTGDVLQTQVNSSFTGTFATVYFQRAVLKQFAS